jgi:hypothetical protein
VAVYLFGLTLALLASDGLAAGACGLCLLCLGGARAVFPDDSLALFTAHTTRVTRDTPCDAREGRGVALLGEDSSVAAPLSASTPTSVPA